MYSNWKKITIEDIASQDKTAIAIGPFGSRMKSDCYVNDGIPVIRGQNITDGMYPEGEFVYITKEKANELKSSQVFEGDLVFPHRGAIGKVALVRDSTQMILSSSLMKLTPDKDKCSPEFLLYFFRSRIGQYELLKNASTVGTPGIGQPLSSLKSISFPLPPLIDQKAIAHILGTIDEKIELNKKTNETLEAIAKSLFKSWFIDFDLVKAKAEDRSTGLSDEFSNLFPDSFEDSEIGQIPSGWDTKKIADFGQTICGKTPSTKNARYYGNDYMFVTIPDLHKGLHITTSSKGLSKSGAESQSKKLLSSGSVLVSCIATPGLIGVIQESCFTNQQINSITPNNKIFTWFIAFYLLLNKDLLLSFGGGGSVFFNLNKSKFDSIVILSPSEKIIDKFNNFTAPLMEKCFTLKREISLLSKTRDALLPRLITGELRIPDAEKIIEEVGI